jgi:hypothetical protein
VQDSLNQALSQPVAINDQFSQAAIPAPTMSLAFSKRFGGAMMMANFAEPVVVAAPVTPDYRFWNPKRTYRFNEENVAYRAGYRSGYNEGFVAAYDGAFRGARDQSYANGNQQGCQQGAAENVGDAFQRGFDQGRDVGYRDTYQGAYDAANQAGYQRQFANASSAAYSANYGTTYSKYFQAARDQAFAQASGALYQQAFDAAKQQEYDATYPGLSQQQYSQGTQDETQKLSTVPVVVLGVSVGQTDANGNVAADQPLNLVLQLRNLSAAGLSGSDFLLELVAADGTLANVTVTSQALVQGLQSQSQTVVTDALGFQMLDASVGLSTTVHFRLSYQGNVVADQDVAVSVANY